MITNPDLYQQVATLLSAWELPPPAELPMIQAACALYYGCSEISLRGFISFVQHELTPHDQCLTLLREGRRHNAIELKLYIISKIILAYDLPIHPVNCIWRHQDAPRKSAHDFINEFEQRFGIPPAQVNYDYQL
jgi:hypothetical protein